MYDAKGNITRAGAEQAIKEGGSVHYKGRVIKSLADLPTETELAVGDPEATQKALDGLTAQRAALDEQEKKLHAENARVEQAKKEAVAAEKKRLADEAKAAKAADTDEDAASRPNRPATPSR